MDYQNSNRKKLRDLLSKINSETGLSMSDLSFGIGRQKDHLNHASSENELHRNGDIKESTLEAFVVQLGNKNLIFRLRYKKSRCFKLKQHTASAAKELNISEGEISLLTSSLLVGSKASANYLSNRMTQSYFSRKGDIGNHEFNVLILTIGKVVKQQKNGERFILSKESTTTPERPVDVISYKREPVSDTKKPTLLNPEQIAEKLKQQLGYSSALWVDGHLVLSDELIKSKGEAL